MCTPPTPHTCIKHFTKRHLNIPWITSSIWGLPLWLSSKESAYNAGDSLLILGSGMATHSSILTWRVLGTEEPGRLQSLGSQRVGLSLSLSPVVKTWLFHCCGLVRISGLGTKMPQVTQLGQKNKNKIANFLEQTTFICWLIVPLFYLLMNERQICKERKYN